MRRHLPFLLFIFITFLSLSSLSQSITPSTFNATGGAHDNPGSYYRYEWSVGEMTSVETFSGSSIVLTTGVLQPFTELVGLSPHIILFTNNEYHLFPSPTTGKFELDFALRLPGNMVMQLLDESGRILESRSLRYEGNGSINHFDISRYPNGHYIMATTFTPDMKRGSSDNFVTIRKSGFKIVKVPR
ncbi:MAG: hypothetical protein H0W12_05215 [Chitinophagaceae bacterium]|nr:hypothetical protein [Chitinophagaceae bacterium]